MVKARRKEHVTKKLIESLEASGSEYTVWDTELQSFGVRVLPSGSKAFIYRYRMGGRGTSEQRYTIAKCSAIPPDQARKIAREKAALVFQGIDPKSEDEKQAKSRKFEEDLKNKLSFEIYCEKYLDERVKIEVPKSYNSLRSCLRIHAKNFLKSNPITSITKNDITSLLDNIPVEKQSVRNQTYIALSKLFKWAVGRGDIPSSPMDGMRPPKPPKKRTRVLSDIELSTVISATRRVDGIFGPFFNLLAITGQRRSEVAGLDWSELNRDECLWTLPEERCKNGVTHLVPLSTAAIGILDHLSGCDEQKNMTWPSKGLVFTTTGRTPISGFSRAKKLLDAAMLKIAKEQASDAGKEPETIEIADWRIHDLRRTMATGFQKLSIRFEVTEATLNHISGMSRAGVAGVYQQHDWKEEKREALEKWAQHCERLLAG